MYYPNAQSWTGNCRTIPVQASACEKRAQWSGGVTASVGQPSDFGFGGTQALWLGIDPSSFLLLVAMPLLLEDLEGKGDT